MEIFALPLRNRYLLVELIKRDVSVRYRGSLMGMVWAIINPLLMLAVYTFFFSVVFKARWGGAEGSRSDFALLLFCGLLMFNFLGEVLNRSPALMLTNANYVKKIVFPLDILPYVVVGSALFHAVIGFLVWFVFFIIVKNSFYVTSLFLPLVFLPIGLFALGFSWLFSSVGVYARDVSQFVTILTAILPFTSPVFFPVSALPESVQPWIYVNPLTVAIEQARSLLFYGTLPSVSQYIIYLVVAVFFAVICHVWFRKTRPGFADVV